MAKMEKKKVTSFAIIPSLDEKLRQISKVQGCSNSEYICSLLRQAAELDPAKEHVVIEKK